MIFEAAHQIGLLPIVAMAIWGRALPRRYWLVAWAFGVSWVADSAQHFLGGTWQAGYIWLPLQIWLVLLAFVRSPLHRVLSGGALVLLAFASAALSWPGPEFLITIAGSAAILFLARGRLAVPLHIYFGYGTLAYVVMAASTEILPAWLAYQSCRALAFIAFIQIIAPPLIPVEGGGNGGFRD